MNLSLTIHDKHLQEANGVIQRTGCLVRMVANSLSRRCRKATKHALAYLVNCSNSNSSCKITLVCKLTLTLSSSVYSLPLFSRLVFLKVPELLRSCSGACLQLSSATNTSLLWPQPTEKKAVFTMATPRPRPLLLDRKSILSL